MKLSLKRRVAFSFIIANIVVLVMGFTVFFFLDSLNNQISNITVNSNKISLLTDEVRISAVSILKMQKKILTTKPTGEDLKRLENLCEGFQSQLQRLDSFYTEVEAKKIISKMQGYVDSLKTIVSKSSLFYRDGEGISTINELTDKILEAFSEFQDIQYFQNEQRDKQVKAIIGETRRNMLITLIITFLGTILLSLVVPGKIAMPFKKINDAVRELQDVNFDVSIYYDQDDEIGELARELNKMIVNMKKFEQLRTDRISVEHRKFDTLANMIKKNIMISNAKGELIYMNNPMYSTLEMQSDDVINKNITDTLIPDSIVETFELAIKRRSKIENAEITIPKRKKVIDPATGEYVFEDTEEAYQGYANVIPIRAKESNLDYYMMIISKEVFV
ncbi:PAS domain-containing protein [Peredibacter starrii]|uniref:histidine kinase n=1 Tax=Peredibacter starrii TaxID=28202 RepID=A0AAX4HPC7_9BACT|nr:PAS domain-containing protein [Peredibacter starrii]WPU64962.1 PAS domain-containing protein [Peredibacter starrii]